MEINEIYLGDCLELMPKHVEDKSIDMIFCDLPYGTTQCKWDSIIDLDKLWKEYKRVIKDNGAIVLFGAEPFSSSLRFSNIKNYKYDWIWHKNKPSGALNAGFMPMISHETISVFVKKGKPIFNHILEPRDATDKTKENLKNINVGKFYGSNTNGETGSKYNRNKNIELRKPTTLKYFKCVPQKKRLHPTEKPLSLIEYMIKTYTNEGDLILDNTCGSGTTGLGAKNLNRNYIMMEQEPKYYEIACKQVQG